MEDNKGPLAKKPNVIQKMFGVKAFCLNCTKKLFLDTQLCEDCAAKKAQENIEKLAEKKAEQKRRLSRIEVIDEGGRRYVRWNCEIQSAIQDDGRTLKLFVKQRTTHAEQTTSRKE